MFTRCTGCHTVHPVNASLLARAGGRYRCGKCQKQGNALDALFDEWPGAGDRPATAGELPVLGMPIDLEQARRSREDPDAAGTERDQPGEAESRRPSRFNLARLTWITAGLAVLVFVVIRYAEFRGEPLLDQPAVRAAQERLGLQEPAAAQPFRDLDRIHLVARELTSHPSDPGLLRLSATIVNRADRPQPYPELEVVLLDEAGEAVSRLRFPPGDYLGGTAPADSAMAPGALLPFMLDLPDPGSAAVGFELDFL